MPSPSGTFRNARPAPWRDRWARLGLGTGKSKTEAVVLIRQASDMGVNLLDAAAA
jgi:hypothetical protein